MMGDERLRLQFDKYTAGVMLGAISYYHTTHCNLSNFHDSAINLVCGF